MGLFRWIAKLFGRKSSKAADGQTSIKGNTYEVFSQAAHNLYYQLLSGVHPGNILLKVRNKLSEYEFPVINPTDYDQGLFTTCRMLENFEKNGWFDHFLTLHEYNLLHMVHRERISYAVDMYTAFRDFSVFKNAIMDAEMANSMENAKKKKKKGSERRLRSDAAVKDADAERNFNNWINTLEEMEAYEIMNAPPPYYPPFGLPPVHRVSVHRRRASYPPPAAPQPQRADRFSIISRVSARSPGPPPPRRLPTPPRNHPDVQHLDGYASAVNTGRNSRGRPNPVNLNLFPPGSPGSPNL